MKKLINNQLSSIYQNGNKMILTSPWQDSNIIVPNNKFYFVKEGEIEIIAGDMHYVVSENEWLLLPAGVLHSYKLTDKKHAKLYWMHFELTLNNKSLFSSLTTPVKIKISNNNKIINLFNKAFKFSKSNTLLSQLEVSTAVNNLAIIFMSKLPSQIAINEEDSIDEVINYISAHWQEKLTLTQLAERANFSVSQFIINFRKRTGVSPIYYINLTKLEHAKYLLEQTAFPIGTIMEKVGYMDCAHFSKIFKKYYGVSPLKYRDKTQPIINGYIME